MQFLIDSFLSPMRGERYFGQCYSQVPSPTMLSPPLSEILEMRSITPLSTMTLLEILNAL